MIELYIRKEGFSKLLGWIKTAKRDLERAESVITESQASTQDRVSRVNDYVSVSLEFTTRIKLKLSIWIMAFEEEWSNRLGQKERDEKGI